MSLSRISLLVLGFGALLGAPSVSDAQNGTDVAGRAAQATLHPGDRIDVGHRRDRELSTTAIVNERGEAVFPKLGAVTVSGIPIGKLQDTLQVRYAEFVREPEFDVQVFRRVVVLGEVRQPNVYHIDINSGVRDAVARAGGLLETASRSRVVIVRDGVRHTVSDWERSEGPDADLQSGDQIIVGRKSWFALNALPLVSTSVIVIGLIQSLRQN
jgi:protein involved in polysaccharide export with SLBB domain